MNGDRIAVAASLAILVGGSVVASAQSATTAKKPLGKITCEDFLAVDDSFKPKMVY
jgi:hypothetical protein